MPEADLAHSDFHQRPSTRRSDLDWDSRIHKGDAVGFLCNWPGRGLEDVEIMLSVLAMSCRVFLRGDLTSLDLNPEIRMCLVTGYY